MKTLVVYHSRHGFTDRCLGLLAQEVPDLELWPVRRGGLPVWTDYEAVVVGGPVYLGQWSPPLVAFLRRQAEALAQHPRVAAFVVSLSPRAAALDYWERGLPPTLAPSIKHVACFGGAIVWKDLAWWEKALVKVVRGIETDVSNLDLGEIQGLATWLLGRSISAKD